MLKIDSSKVNVSIEGKKAKVEFSMKENDFKILSAISKPFSEKVKSLVDVELEMKNKESKK